MKRFSVLISIINFKSTQSPMNAPKLDVFPFYFNLIINRYLARKKRTFLPLMSTFLNQNTCRGELWVLTFVSFIQGKLNVQKRVNFLFFVLKILMTFFSMGFRAVFEEMSTRGALSGILNLFSCLFKLMGRTFGVWKLITSMMCAKSWSLPSLEVQNNYRAYVKSRN